MCYRKSIRPQLSLTSVINHYNVVPEFVPSVITEDAVQQVSGRMTGAAGTGGINAAGLQQWLLRFGVTS